MDTPLWTLDLPALEAGYHLDETRKAYVCLCCGKLYPQQEAFPVDGRLLLAEAAVRGWVDGSAQTYYENGVRAACGSSHSSPTARRCIISI